jgi:hypothetical protein
MSPYCTLPSGPRVMFFEVLRPGRNRAHLAELLPGGVRVHEGRGLKARLGVDAERVGRRIRSAGNPRQRVGERILSTGGRCQRVGRRIRSTGSLSQRVGEKIRSTSSPCQRMGKRIQSTGSDYQAMGRKMAPHREMVCEQVRPFCSLKPHDILQFPKIVAARDGQSGWETSLTVGGNDGEAMGPRREGDFTTKRKEK